MNLRLVLLLIYAVSVGIANAQDAPSNAKKFLGGWALEMPDGAAGWLGVVEEENGLRGELWTVGGGKKLTELKVVNDQLSFVRNVRIGKPKFVGGPPTGERVPCRYTATVKDKMMRLVMYKPSGDSTEKVRFPGKLMPPLPPKPDLAKVKFGPPIELFNGKNLDGWKLTNPKQINGWKAVNGELVNTTPKLDFSAYSRYGNLQTVREFMDFNLKIEFKVPPGGNSGVYLRGIYEAQVLDRDSKMQGIQGVGAIFGRIKPTENAGKLGNEWNTYDITLVDRHATVILNGKKVIDNERIYGCTNGALHADETIPGPLYLQGDHTAVSYRNIVLRPVVKDEAGKTKPVSLKMPKIAVMETAFGKRGDVTSIQDAMSAGYAAIQMHSGQPKGFKKPIDQSIGLEIGKDPAVLESWKAASAEQGVQIISLCAGTLNKCQIWDRDREVAMRIAKQTIDACQKLDAPIMLFPFFGPSKFQDSDEALHGVAGFLRELLPFAKEQNVVIGIEAPVTTVRVLELMKVLEFPENLKIYYDTGNLFSKEDIYETIRKHGKEHFCEVHIKAADHLVAGEGKIDLAKLAKALDDAEYDQWLVYEANRTGKDPVANRKAIEKLVSLRKKDVFDKQNLVAWCIVPFDAMQRGPAERAAMLKRLGLTRVAYDWREKHISTFEEEIRQYQKHGIEFFAFWNWHDSIGPLIKQYKVTPQIWKTAPSPRTSDEQERVEAAAQELMPLVKKTRELGLQLGLYNHGGWGGEPKSLVEVCEHLREHHNAKHVGIVYNLHHAHGDLDQFAESLKQMQPYLLCLNLNGMTSEEDLKSNPKLKILPIGSGSNDKELLRVIRGSGYVGPIGVLDHRNEIDAEESLQQNLDGLSNLLQTSD